ncbi:hypothetical protein FHL15_009459 [Xylaria flabelliformis]|uniref:Uncharacterized protein n=1 Tax=Xylaria flabelliformis TaxID=2512241 RepID=A0A553HP80_9PEZI|nr:hypothetical protein FHL15_009459 [Xylaria flabelliformis]
MEVNTEGQANDYTMINRQNLVAHIRDFQHQASQGRSGGLLIAVEDPGSTELNDIGAILDIDPFFLAGHLAVSYPAIEQCPSSPLHGLLPSRIASVEHINIHFQKVLDLGQPSNSYPEPRQINVEEVVSLPTYSSFAGSTERNFSLRGLSQAEDLLSILREQRITLNSGNTIPSVLDLAHYPIRIALIEWKLYVQLMSRYVKFFETLSARLEQKDVTELHRWRRRTSQSLHKIRMIKAFVDYWCGRNGGVAQKYDSWDLLVLDLTHIEMQIKQ